MGRPHGPNNKETTVRNSVLAVMLVLMSMVFACSDKPTAQTEADPAESQGLTVAPAIPVKAGTEPLTAELVEQDGENVAFWLGRGLKDRTVIRLSAFPGLVKVGDDKIEALRGMIRDGRTDEIMKAADANGKAPLFKAENTLYVAHRLGIIKEVVWVVPIFLSVDKGEVEYFKEELVKQLPELKKEIDGIKLSGKTAKLTLNGVPVTVVGLQDLVPPDSPAILDVECSFLAALYQGEKNTSSLSFVAGMFKLIQKAGVVSDAVSITASNADNVAPLKFRKLCVYLVEMMKDPKLIEGNPPTLWKERAAAWKAEQADMELAVPIYKSILKSYPDDAATHYDLAALYYSLGELEYCANELAAAAKSDKAYLVGFEQIRDNIISSGNAELGWQFYTRKPKG